MNSNYDFRKRVESIKPGKYYGIDWNKLSDHEKRIIKDEYEVWLNLDPKEYNFPESIKKRAIALYENIYKKENLIKEL